MPRRRNARKLQPVAVYQDDRIYLRTEAARRDILPADVAGEAVTLYRQTSEDRDAEPALVVGKDDAALSKGVA